MNMTLDQFSEFARRFRSRELSALRAENLLMRRALHPSSHKENHDGHEVKRPNSTVEAVDRVLNGEPLHLDQVLNAVGAKFPEREEHNESIYRALRTLVYRNRVSKVKRGGRCVYTRLASLLLLPFLFSCRLGTPDFKDDPRFEDSTAAIMPRRLPDAPQPKLAPVLPTTTSVRLSWERVPAAKAYRVDYGTDFLTNSLMTQATDCTIHGLELGRVYHYNVRACDGRNYGPVLSVFIK